MQAYHYKTAGKKEKNSGKSVTQLLIKILHHANIMTCTFTKINHILGCKMSQ